MSTNFSYKKLVDLYLFISDTVCIQIMQDMISNMLNYGRGCITNIKIK